jgi:hypothetical protein
VGWGVGGLTNISLAVTYKYIIWNNREFLVSSGWNILGSSNLHRVANDTFKVINGLRTLNTAGFHIIVMPGVD